MDNIAIRAKKKVVQKLAAFDMACRYNNRASSFFSLLYGLFLSRTDVIMSCSFAPFAAGRENYVGNSITRKEAAATAKQNMEAFPFRKNARE